VEKNLKQLTRYAVAYFKNLIKKYGKGRERRTEISTFDVVDRTQVVAATETLYVNSKDGFAGWGLKKDESVEKCSKMDDIIAFDGEGVMRVTKVADKAFVGKRVQHIAVFRKDDEKVYSMIYRDGRQGAVYAKRFKVGGVTRDKEYDLTKGTKGSRVIYFAVHDSEEESAENAVLVHLKPAPRLRSLSRLFGFGELALKGRSVKGNLVTKHTVDRIVRAPKDGGDLELK